MSYWFGASQSSDSDSELKAPGITSAKIQGGKPVPHDEEPNWLSEYKSPVKRTTAANSPSASSSSSGLSNVGKNSDESPEVSAKRATGTKKATPAKSPKGKVSSASQGDLKPADAGEKARLPPGTKIKVAAAELPLVLPEKLQRNKMLVECPGDTEATDLDGDVGAVGRFNVVGRSMQLDLKGVIYTADVVPSHTFLIVNIGTQDARVEAMMNDFVQLHPKDGGQGEDDQLLQFGDESASDWESDDDRGKKKGGKSGVAKKRKIDEIEAEVAGADAVLGDRSKEAQGSGRGKGSKSARGGRGGRSGSAKKSHKAGAQARKSTKSGLGTKNKAVK